MIRYLEQFWIGQKTLNSKAAIMENLIMEI